MIFFLKVKKKLLIIHSIKSGNKEEGFTLIELLIAMSIISIIAISIRPIYTDIIIKAKEASLKKNLFTIREAIDSYYTDHVDENNLHYYPKSLSNLINEKYKYLRYIPEDPFTEKEDWILVYSDNDDSKKGIFDIKSTSNSIGSNGRAYNDW